MINIKNSQRKIKININEIRKITSKMLRTLGYDEFDISIWFTTNSTIRNYNKRYRGKDSPTDILSFSYHPNLKPGERVRAECDEDRNLGDLIIAPEYVQKDAPRWNQNFEERLRVLIAHGIAHLLGYDHQSDKEYKIMQKVEKELLDAI